ncbi:unnamed protein product [Cladocopium goreaui]|uniref:Uncharacterized protein n=1 Tax=Cladocopium goreaui TaxID=2562237 RepID=A0A9P1GMZ6_9DINO|nr:unnamed protein product [Cladocopium goreaui]
MALSALSANGWRKEPESLCSRISETEATAHRLQEELSTILRGLAALKEQVRDADDLAGDTETEKIRQEVDDVLRRQGTVLEEMVKSAESFPRRWAQFELNISQRKSLLLSIKARRARDQAER